MPRALSHQPSEDQTPCVVLDNGTGFIKAGFAGEEAPRAIVATSGLSEAGDVRPTERGVIKDWDAMEAYWDQAFAQLRVDTEHCNLVVTSPLFDPKDNRERLMQCLFETFAAPGVYTSAPAVFEMYAAGRENGVILGCGAQCTYAVCVHEGLPDPRTQFRSDLAGEALTAHAASVLQKCGAGGAVDAATACRAKEALAAVAPLNSAGEAQPDAAAAGPVQFELPDGKKLTVSAAARAELAEPLFQPSMLGEHSGGLARLVSEAIRVRDRDGALESNEHGKDGTDNWYRSIVLAGGTTMIPGLQARLVGELGRHAPDGCTPEVCAPPERMHAAWLGGSILASLAVVGQMWITKEEYDENGPLIVHRKCF